MLQRISGTAAHVTLDGYWVPMVIKGEGRIGCLCPHDEIELRPGTQADIDQIVEPRTSASAPARSVPKSLLSPGTVECNYLGPQASRESLVNWDELPSMLDKDKYVHVITDGGARPNPGNAGWGAIIRQNGKFSWTFGHCSRATNNAMELLAVIEALRALPNGMRVWISTDSCYVKRGVTEWLVGWIARSWRNSQGAQVANRSLWQKLVEAMNRMAIVQWTWVKAHAGYLLNECADMLATKGVRNETPPARVQFLHPINEDTDMEAYAFQENELPTPPRNWTGDSRPPEDILYPSTRLNLASTVPSPVPALSESSPFSVMLSDSEEESSNPWPAPATDSETEDGKGPAQSFPTIVSLPTPPADPVPEERPLWWGQLGTC
jgi:ribonuclease HI